VSFILSVSGFRGGGVAFGGSVLLWVFSVVFSGSGGWGCWGWCGRGRGVLFF